MNDWNSMEDQLRCWKARQPSPALKQRLFATPSSPPAAAHALAFGGGWRWLAPVMGSFLLMLVLSSPKQDDVAYLAAVTNRYMVESQSNSPWNNAGSMAGLTARFAGAAFIGEGFHSKQNLPNRDVFEWTGHTKSFALPAPAPVVHTNTLLP